MDEQFCDACEFQMVCDMAEELPERCPYRTLSEDILDGLLEDTEVTDILEEDNMELLDEDTVERLLESVDIEELFKVEDD